MTFSYEVQIQEAFLGEIFISSYNFTGASRLESAGSNNNGACDRCIDDVRLEVCVMWTFIIHMYIIYVLIGWVLS